MSSPSQPPSTPVPNKSLNAAAKPFTPGGVSGTSTPSASAVSTPLTNSKLRPSAPVFNPNAPVFVPKTPSFNPNAPAFNPNAPVFVPTNGPSTPAVKSTSSQPSTPATPAPASGAASSTNGTASAASPAIAAVKKSPASPLIPALAGPIKPRESVPASQRVRKPKADTPDDFELKPRAATASDDKPATNGDDSASTAAPASTSTEDASSSSNSDSRKYTREMLLAFKTNAVLPPSAFEAVADLVKDILAGSTPSGKSAGFRGTPTNAQSLRPGASSSRFPAGAGARPSAGTPRNDGRGQLSRANMGTAMQPARNGTGRSRKPDAPMDIEIVPLAQTENRYQIATEIAPDQKVLRSLNSILNKLTPEKFDTLAQQVLDLNIHNVGLLRDVVTAVFEKALAEPNFSPTYAEFCVKLAPQLPAFPTDENDEQTLSQNFKRLLLNRCQTEFESEADTTEKVKTMNTEEKEEYLAKMKRRTLGTIRFIGELFIRGMLAPAIMRHCIVLLFGDVEQPIEEDIEALCRLLDTVGKKLDSLTQKEQKEFVTTTFNSLKTLSTSKSLSSRIRFMIQDTIDLRTRNWVKRIKNEVDAKKISDVHKEAAQPATRSIIGKLPSSSDRGSTLSLGPGGGSRLRPGYGGDRYSQLGKETSPRKKDGEWETVGSSSGLNRFGKRSQDVRTVQPSQPTATPVKPAETVAKNAFDLLNAGDDENVDGEENEVEAVEGEIDTEDVQVEESKVPALSESDLRSKYRSMFREYITAEDVKEIEEQLRELQAYSRDHIVIEAMNVHIEGTTKEKAFVSLAKCFEHLHQKSLITSKYLETGFKYMLEAASDLELDNPRTVEFISIVLAGVIGARLLPLSYLSTTAIPTLALGESSTDATKMVINVLQNLRKLKGDDETIAIAKESSFKFADAMDSKAASPEAVKKLLTDKKLEILVDLI